MKKVAFITGGSKGIGQGIASILVQEGWRVAITGRTLADVEKVAHTLNHLHPQSALALQADVRDYAQLEAAVQATEKAFGRIDVVVANAGVGHFAPIDTLSVAHWHETIDTNLTGVFYSVRAALPLLRQSKGYIFTIASLAGTNFFANGSAYNASKFGLVGFTQAIMLDLRASGIRVSTIMPGSVATYFDNHTPTAADAWKIQPEDIGQLIADVLKLNPRTLPSKIEVRPAQPPGK
jgi:NAD(P)-dependent dehydrogenase (short-subunit alcohol dehydrogenase family)